jgi:CelD/BcsL family acetyltransferase involved in cellulose biosynthesis
MMRMTAITTVEGVLALRREWEALATASAQAGPFLSWPWARAALGRLRDATPCALAARAEDGELRALMPLVNHGGGLRFVAAERSIYLGMLARADDLAPAAQAFARWLRGARAWRTMVLSALPQEQLHPLAEALAEAGITYRVERDRPSYVLPLPDSAAVFAERLAGSFRKRLDYYRRRLERECAVEYRVASPRDSPQAFADFLRLHRLRMDAKGRRSHLAEGEYADFIREALTAMDGAASVGLLRCDGRAAAALAGMRWGDTFYFWNSGFDPAFAQYNVGDLIQRLTMETAIAAGLRRFDFLWGGEAYKLRWGAQRRDTYRLQAGRSRLRLAVCTCGRRAIRASRRATAAAARRLRPSRPRAWSPATRGEH